MIIILSIMAVLMMPATTPVTLDLQIDQNRVEISGHNVEGVNYFRLYDIAEAIDIDQTQILARRWLLLRSRNINGNYYFSLRDVAAAMDFRLHWVGSRNTILVDTSRVIRPEEAIFSAEPLPEYVLDIIRGRSFRDYAPFDYSFLSYLTITHIDFSGQRRIGHMIVAAELADEVLDIFREIYEYGFPIYRIRLIDFYGTQDYLSMADNNSVAFNFRNIAGTNRLSRHALGRAIDINPIQNPYIRGSTVWPDAGQNYLDRFYVRPGMIVRGDVVYRAFTSRGWTWGGNWTLPRDYHHFERP